MEDKLEIEIAKMDLRITQQEMLTSIMQRDLHKIVTQLAGLKWFIIGAIAVESPQAIESIKLLLGG